MRKFLLLLSLCVVPSLSLAEPREILTYVTDSGTVSFTDELKRVPQKYQDDVEVITVDGLNDYARGTRSDDGAYVKHLEARLSHLRKR